MIWSKEEAGAAGVVVTVADRAALLADLRARFETGVGFSVATLNLDHVVKLKRDAQFRAAYLRQTHVTADGNPIVWFCRLAGQGDVALIPGSELIDPVADLAAEADVDVALFGADDTSLAKAADALEARHPGLRIVSCQSPPMGFDPDSPLADEAIKAIGESGARLVFLALGAPKQERFAARAQERLPQVGFLSIGAGLDFISGAQKRAPKWVRAIASEWIWRMLSNPRRLAARYGTCILALPGLTLRALAARRKAP
ncbi:N-acetylglucosaminyldiphosphoundecaprenol N-acetyl-beta-D-mannosaminyltransferase (plasmid) [Roseobacter fucihabitans]|uniref:N-acetylglucosaminyldiphosphoundecaprenol N-acetyl-beta-D-mannosaminyltransferase n=1 Tax=Roseobacter fucihabitans TaxID=1537242 RepID=A0ABZ2C0D7_9RHOB